MSRKHDHILSLSNIVPDLSNVNLNELFKEVLKDGMHGIGFSPYLEGQEPGEEISEEQIRKRMAIIKPHVKWVRSFSCTEGNELIPKIAHEMGIKTLVGAWLGKDEEMNRLEIENLIKAAKAGYVDIVAVGNEVMYRKDLTEDQLLGYIQQVKNELPHIPVGYVDAYYEFENRPRITEACDVILANCYPFWEGCHIDYSLLYMQDMYRRTVRAAKGKKVIITETGWPNKGQSFHGAVPSQESAIRYFLNTQLWSKADNIESFYFSSFDEPWKIGDEGDVGAFWGLWDKNENLKY
ncbi:glycosyl hydrolase family 17 protein [Salibacteraceae bacterium]|jgi:exo-beta-1,3-glucanase (GH17 family)|nr:glycosyl hydrolase family 17 protein [Salibacteraceae bacterium]MDC1220138.1 glycosyl hydrolase family 17 protein [bacterium]MDA9267372.1 glycosyl hydrolase family 17 protein [Salibacteraceae bacterium]MDB0002409.1 glycosyl hydrolase family 17 protein [Salibacteraceae bacterium]MDB4104166.1 glycosyl hydrolase family 17 protein [Salibacteraceae bacterium]